MLIAIAVSLLAHGALVTALWLWGGTGEPGPTPRLGGIREEPTRIRWVPSALPRPVETRAPAGEETAVAPRVAELEGALLRPALPERPPLPIAAPAGENSPPTVAPPPREPPPDLVRSPPDEPLPPPRPAATVSARSGPVLIGRIQPVYPRSCLAARHEGVVELLLRVDSEGKVTGAELVRTSGCRELDAAARKAALRLRYEPGRDEEGRAVAGEARLRVRFVIEPE